MSFTTTTGYSWVDGEVVTATKLNSAGLPTVADGQAYTFSNTGLLVKDTGGSNSLAIVPGSAMTAARTLTITTGDASRTITLSGNPTLSDWFNQGVKTSDSPTFSTITITSTAIDITANWSMSETGPGLLAVRSDSAGSIMTFNTNGSVQLSSSYYSGANGFYLKVDASGNIYTDSH